MTSSLRGHERKEDFSVYYLSALELRAGIDPYSTNFKSLANTLGLETHALVRGTHPPTFLLLFEPFTALSIKTAYWTWSGLNFAALALALVLLFGLESQAKAATALALSAAAVWYAPVLLCFWFGQSNLLILLMLVLMMRWIRQDNPAGAGMMLALSGLTRVFPLAIGAYMLSARRWRILAFAAAGLMLGTAITVAVAGWANCLSFAHLRDQDVTDGVSYLSGRISVVTPRNIAPSAFISRCLWHFWGPHLSLAADRLRYVLIICADAAVLALNCQATRSRRLEDDPEFRLFSLWIVTSLMLSPMVWLHYEVLLLLPFAQLAIAFGRGRASRRAVYMALVSAAFSYATLGTYIFAPHSVLEECGFASLLAAYVSCYWFATDEFRVATARVTESQPLAVDLQAVG